MTNEQQTPEVIESNQPAPNNGKNFAIAALICGILGIVGGFIPVVNYFTTILAILGIVFGAMGIKRVGPEHKGLAVAGLVCGIVGTAFAVIAIICVACITAAALSVPGLY